MMATRTDFNTARKAILVGMMQDAKTEQDKLMFQDAIVRIDNGENGDKIVKELLVKQLARLDKEN